MLGSKITDFKILTSLFHPKILQWPTPVSIDDLDPAAQTSNWPGFKLDQVFFVSVCQCHFLVSKMTAAQF